MPDQELHKDRSELISRYLSGNATEAEVQQLEAWVLADPQNRAVFMAFRKAWMLSGMQADTQAVDVEELWAQTSATLFEEEEAKVTELTSRRGNFRWLRIAAAVALILSVSIWALIRFSGEREFIAATGDAVEAFELPDGTRVTLNRSSSLAYTPAKADPRAGTPAQRRIQLSGDAFFDVTRDPDRPFIIRSGALEIEVLGTSFYVDAREDQAEMQVIVATGSVAVRASAEPEVTLVAGDKAVFRRSDSSLSKQPNDDRNFQSIRTDTLVFDNSSLEEVAFALSRHYQVEVSYAGIADTTNCRLQGIFPDYSLSDILTTLEATWEIEVEQAGEVVRLSGDFCK